MRKYLGLFVCVVVLCLLLSYLALLSAPCLTYEAIGVFLEAKDGATYLTLGNGHGYSLGHVWDDEYLVNDDVCRAYNVISLDNYDTSMFQTGDVLSLTRKTSLFRRCRQQVWIHMHATGEYKKIMADFENSQPRSGNSLDFVSYEDSKFWFMSGNSGGLVSFGDGMLEKVGKVSHNDVRVGLGLTLGSVCGVCYRFSDDVDDIPDFVWYYE